MSKMILILSCALLAATGVQAFAQGQVVTVEGVADAKGQPLLSAKRVAWMDAMRTLAEQVAGMDFVLDAHREGHIRYTVRSEAAPAGSAQQVSAETLPTGIYKIVLKIEVEPAPPDIADLPEITAEGKGDIGASRSRAAARAAAKATAMAEAIKKAAIEVYEKAGQPIPRTLRGHAWYLGPVSERVEGNFYFMTAKFKVRLAM